MPIQPILEMATGGHQQVPQDWMPASGAEPLVKGDPAITWLKYHGEAHGLRRDTSPYEFLGFIGKKAKQFEDKWAEVMAPDAIQVCAHAYEVRHSDKVRETFELMQKGTPVLLQPALWWAPERIYGTPDVLVHTSWLENHYPQLMQELARPADAPNLARTGGHYILFDLKFTSKLDDAGKAKDLASYNAQVKLYAYMLGHLQGLMPKRGYLVTRDRIFNPIPVEISLTLNQPLESTLAAVRDQFLEIKVNGDQYVPWHDAIVASDISNRDEQWRTAKRIIASEKTPGRDPGIVYQIGAATKRDLARYGFPTLDSLLQASPPDIPLEMCKNLGQANIRRIRAILQANRSGSAVKPHAVSAPLRKEFEFYVDFEYFTNINVDFDRQWPTLEGCEMIFMVGVGWEEAGGWAFRTLVASAEDPGQERTTLEAFVDFLDSQTQGGFVDEARTSIYHWTSAEAWQAHRASDRHGFPDAHPLRSLPWVDLYEVFLDGPIALPGAWTYKLKHVTKALADLYPELELTWPGNLDQGLRAMVMGWSAYQTPNPLESREMMTLTEYLEADCKALWGILKWMRSRGGKDAS
jgi:uncharacterized protein